MLFRSGRAKPKAPATHSVKAGPKGLCLLLREMEAQKSSDRFAFNHPFVPLCLLEDLKPKLQSARLGLGSLSGLLFKLSEGMDPEEAFEATLAPLQAATPPGRASLTSPAKRRSARSTRGALPSALFASDDDSSVTTVYADGEGATPRPHFRL